MPCTATSVPPLFVNVIRARTSSLQLMDAFVWAEVTATVTSAQTNASINCSDDVRARITLTNNGGTDVAVQGILKRSGVTAGRCFGDHDFTYPTGRGIAPARATTIVLD